MNASLRLLSCQPQCRDNIATIMSVFFQSHTSNYSLCRPLEQLNYRKESSMNSMEKILLHVLLFHLSSINLEPTVAQPNCPKSCHCNMRMKQFACNRATTTSGTKIPKGTKYLYISNMPFKLSYLHGLTDLHRLYLENASITNISRYNFQGKTTTYSFLLSVL